MPERCEILVWSYVASSYSDGYFFNNFAYPNCKLIQRSQYSKVHLTRFSLIWKSYGKRLIAQVINDNSVVCNIVINMSQFGQVACLPSSVKLNSKISCYFERNDGYILAVVHRTANFISIDITDQFKLPPNIGYDPFFDRTRWLKHLHEHQRMFVDKPIAEALLNQEFFNGVGNWMRAEILHLSQIPPFDSLSTVLESELQLNQLVLAMDTVLQRTLALMDSGFDINDAQQQQSFKSSLLVYGKGQRIIYTKLGNRRPSKALWVAASTSNFGALAVNYEIVPTKRTQIKVGPWEGWDSLVASSYNRLNFGGSFWHLCHHLQDAFGARKPGRYRIVRNNQRGRPRHDVLPSKALIDERITLSNMKILFPVSRQNK